MTSKPISSQRTGDAWAFILAYAAILAFGLTFQALPPLLQMIKQELALTYSQAGFLIGLFSLPGIVLTIPIGIAADRHGPKAVAIASLAAMTAGLLIMMAGHTFLVIAMGRALSGLGGLSLALVAAQIISRHFQQIRLNRAMGFYNTGMPLGTIIAFLAFGNLGASFGWRLPLVFLTVYCVLLAALFLLFFKEEKLTPSQVSFYRPAQIIAEVRHAGRDIWLVGISWMWFNAAGIAWLGFGPLFFIDMGYSRLAAGALAGALMWGALVLSPVVGRMMDVYMSKRDVIIFGNLMMAVVFALMPVAGPLFLLPLMIALAIAAALPPTPVFAYPAQLVERHMLGLAFGILSTCLNVGSVIGPWVVGALRQAFGTYSSGFVFMAFAVIVSAVVVMPLKGDRNLAVRDRP